MAVNQLTNTEAEAIAMLSASEPRLWDILEGYFKRVYLKEAEATLDCNHNAIDIHRGRARAFRQIVGVRVDAQNKVNG